MPHDLLRTRARRLARRCVLTMIAAASVVAGGAAMWRWIDPENIHAVRTVELFGVFALFVLPASTWLAMEWERRRRPLRIAARRRAEARALGAAAEHATIVEAHEIAPQTQPRTAQERVVVHAPAVRTAAVSTPQARSAPASRHAAHRS